MKKVWPSLLLLLCTACAKDNKTFTLKTIRLNEYRRTRLPEQKLYLQVFGDKPVPLAHTEYYSADLSLPATFKVYPATPMTLYSKEYTVQLWGTISGYISSCRINMEEYKIIFPIDMEIKNDSLNISLAGSWQ